jgi:hypothetical protein
MIRGIKKIRTDVLVHMCEANDQLYVLIKRSLLAFATAWVMDEQFSFNRAVRIYVRTVCSETSNMMAISL